MTTTGLLRLTLSIGSSGELLQRLSHFFTFRRCAATPGGRAASASNRAYPDAMYSHRNKRRAYLLLLLIIIIIIILVGKLNFYESVQTRVIL